MKSKKFFLPVLILAAGIAAAVVLACALNVVKKPMITGRGFGFTITYEYAGITETVEDSFWCSYQFSDVSGGDQIYYWQGGIVSLGSDHGEDSFVIHEDPEGILMLVTGLYPEYLMGDPSYREYGDEECAPYGYYYSKTTGEELFGEETLHAHGLKIIDWEYPEPIENEFVFSRIGKLDGDTSFALALTAVCTLIVCMILVKKDPDILYTKIDRASVVCNFINALVLFPFITLVCMFADINGGGGDLIYQIDYCIPAFSFFCLAASVCLRRTGCKKSSLLIQFAGPAVFVLSLTVETIGLL